jgi:hypothetical protein
LNPDRAAALLRPGQELPLTTGGWLSDELDPPALGASDGVDRPPVEPVELDLLLPEPDEDAPWT